MSELTGTYEDEIEASLKPCPRCNGKALIENFDEILCDSCGLWSGDDWPSLDEAVEWWNKQPHIEALNQRIAELEARGDWEPVIYSTFIDDDSHDEAYLLATLGGTQLEIGTDPTSDGVTVNLPKEYRLCRRVREGEE